MKDLESEDAMKNTTVKYPDIHVKLVGTDGNAFALVGRVAQALRRAKVDEADIKAFTDECFNSKSYDALLGVLMRTVNVS